MVKTVLFSCSNGNTFNEVFYPIIKEMGNLCRAYVLVSDFCLNETARGRLYQLKKDHRIEKFRILHPNRGRESLSHYHKRLSAITDSLSGMSIDMIVMSGDFQIDNRYVLSPFLGPHIKRVVLQEGMVVRVLKAYRRAKGLEKKQNRRDLLWPLRTFKNTIRRLRSRFHQWQNHYFFPYWCQKSVFPLTGYEQLAFAAGICEHVICYDPLLKEALQATNPLLKHVYVSRHPMDRGWSENSNRLQGQTGRLLVLTSGLLSMEMPQQKINRWVEVAGEVVRLKNIREIHLRLHPRTAPFLKWPKEMLMAMQKLGCPMKLVDSRKTCLDEGLDLYDGIIGSPSASLRVARAMNKSMFILGLPNCCDGDENDQPWLLGSGEGIQWLEEGETIQIDQLTPPPVVDDKRPKVSDILLNLLDSLHKPN